MNRLANIPLRYPEHPCRSPYHDDDDDDVVVVDFLSFPLLGSRASGQGKQAVEGNLCPRSPEVPSSVSRVRLCLILAPHEWGQGRGRRSQHEGSSHPRAQCVSSRPCSAMQGSQSVRRPCVSAQGLRKMTPLRRSGSAKWEPALGAVKCHNKSCGHACDVPRKNRPLHPQQREETLGHMGEVPCTYSEPLSVPAHALAPRTRGEVLCWGPYELRGRRMLQDLQALEQVSDVALSFSQAPLRR